MKILITIQGIWTTNASENRGKNTTAIFAKIGYIIIYNYLVEWQKWDAFWWILVSEILI
jgi:hypothetical protein